VSEDAIKDPKRRSDKGQSPKLIAYRLSHWPPMRLVVAPADRDWMDATHYRDWMDATHYRFAHRCLPLRIAAQAGWFILNSHALRVTWNGGNDTSDIELPGGGLLAWSR
jgi:hypothetical protein